MEQVIIKRLPIQEISKLPSSPTSDVGTSCECVDGIFGSADPSCGFCGGTGVIEAVLPIEWVTKSTGKKKVWVTKATIVVDDASAIYDDEEEAIISDIHAFFDPKENIEVGDLVIPSNSKTKYVVRDIQQVRNMKNVVMCDCALEIA